ncbi:hypothetical protein EX30DRAFT_171147 [Ascodesmis nigricans]|uniref:E3 UFM1-protein ligase 1-like N-terminal domain-containing protein n=1 Tax=Ascodesmis nigricans TaxID=341454 RepID=A0A4S2MLW9_9PEZI|nr:hypothetical protein EX30DRAFT_171147 [Ascodesmis nigricans]
MATVTPRTAVRTTTFEIAGAVRLDVDTVERLLPVEEVEWGRVGPSVIIRRPEFQRLRNDVAQQLSTGIIDVMEFCKINQIDWDLFLKITPRNDGSWAWLGNMSHVYGLQFARNVEEKVMQELEAIESPIELTTLFGPYTSSQAFARHILTGLITSGRTQGSISNAMFVPTSYVERRRADIILELQSNGIIEAIQKEGVRDPEAFVLSQLPDSVPLGEHFITPIFLARIESSILENIDKQGWSDVKDPEQRLSFAEEKKLRALVSKSLPGVQLVADRFVPQELEGTLRSKTQEFAYSRAEAEWNLRYSLKTPTPTWTELLKHLSVESSLTPGMLSHFMTTLHPYCLTVFSDHLHELRQQQLLALKNGFLRKFVLRFLVYLEGTRSIVDKSLHSKLESELCRFGKEAGLSALEKLESVFVDDPTANLEQLHALKALLEDVQDPKNAGNHLAEIERTIRDAMKSLDMSFPDGDEISVTKDSLVKDMTTKLQAASDLSLQVLLVILLVYARQGAGVLKASGKYVPKLLKELQSTGALSEGQFSVLSKAKGAVTGKGTMTEEEFEELKVIGTGTGVTGK